MGNCQVKPVNNVADAKNLADINNLVRYVRHISKTGEIETIFKHLKFHGYIGDDLMLTTGLKPMNVFARLASGEMPNPVDQSGLGTYAEEFMVCHNLPERDANWNNPNDFTASMAGPYKNGPGHVFITTRDLDWRKFNILPIILSQDLIFLAKLLLAAETYVMHRGWRRYGLYFHCYPNNTVNSLHLHVINLDKIGHMFYAKKSQNISLYDVISNLRRMDTSE